MRSKICCQRRTKMLKKAVLICLLTMLAASCCHIERNRHTAYVRHHGATDSAAVYTHGEHGYYVHY